MDENEQNLTEDRAQTVNNVRNLGFLAAICMSLTILSSYIVAFSPQFQDRNHWVLGSIGTIVCFYVAFKALQPLCEINLVRPFHASWIFWIVMVATAYFKERFYSAEFMLIFFTLFTLSAISWTILNFRLARVTQNPLFKFHAIILIVSVISSLTVFFLKANPGSVLYYADAAITATSQGLLVGVWYDVDDVEDV
ncbi:hypothetical protein [uncultured Campylobacter sp.]|uniref:hypothetical protein n=1 Tax=uncultured Campylobacter sp. TaxID=218934 RepID=UPI0028E67DBD|nr:hypothetical protein [uncultured Campylobacter sp.]